MSGSNQNVRRRDLEYELRRAGFSETRSTRHGVQWVHPSGVVAHLDGSHGQSVGPKAAWAVRKEIERAAALSPPPPGAGQTPEPEHAPGSTWPPEEDVPYVGGEGMRPRWLVGRLMLAAGPPWRAVPRGHTGTVDVERWDLRPATISPTRFDAAAPASATASPVPQADQDAPASPVDFDPDSTASAVESLGAVDGEAVASAVVDRLAAQEPDPEPRPILDGSGDYREEKVLALVRRLGVATSEDVVLGVSTGADSVARELVRSGHLRVVDPGGRRGGVSYRSSWARTDKRWDPPDRKTANPREVEDRVAAIEAYVAAHPGCRGPEVRTALGLGEGQWSVAWGHLQNSGRVIQVGHRKHARYYAPGAVPGASRPTVPAAATTAAVEASRDAVSSPPDEREEARERARAARAALRGPRPGRMDRWTQPAWEDAIVAWLRDRPQGATWEALSQAMLRGYTTGQLRARVNALIEAERVERVDDRYWHPDARARRQERAVGVDPRPPKSRGAGPPERPKTEEDEVTVPDASTRPTNVFIGEVTVAPVRRGEDGRWYWRARYSLRGAHPRKYAWTGWASPEEVRALAERGIAQFEDANGVGPEPAPTPPEPITAPTVAPVAASGPDADTLARAREALGPAGAVMSDDEVRDVMMRLALRALRSPS